MSKRSGVRSPASACIFCFAASSWLFFSRDCVNILRNISCPIYSILFLFPRARKTRIIPFLFYATPPRIEARRIKRISGIIGHGQTSATWAPRTECLRNAPSHDKTTSLVGCLALSHGLGAAPHAPAHRPSFVGATWTEGVRYKPAAA